MPIAKLTFTTAVAIDRNMFYAAADLDDLDPDDFESFSRMVFYQDQTNEKWFYHDLPDWRVVSVCFPSVRPDQVRVAIALSDEGDVEFYSRNGSVVEKIPDAGLSSSGPGYGIVTRIRSIDGELYVCGDSGQVYVRQNNQWEHIDRGLLQTFEKTLEGAISSIQNGHFLVDVNGYHRNDLYVCGNDGFLAHFDGATWRRIAVKTDEHLNSIHCDEKGVVVVGFNGTVLVGDAKSGFRDISSFKDNNYLYSVTRHDGVLYIGADDGLYTFDKAMKLVPASKKYRLKEVDHVESKDGVLWVQTSKVLLRLHENIWQPLYHPDNGKAPRY